MKQEKPPKKQLIKPEMLIAAFAILISISTLFVYIYQSNLMKQQQKMSVWPYLNYVPSWGQDYFIVNLTNKGIGPAIIENVAITFDGKEIEGIEGIMKLVPDSIRGSYSFSTIPPGLVIMAGEALTLLDAKEPRAVAYIMENILTDKLYMAVCYSSVYGDSWVSYGLQVEESRCR
ncbi:MAG: hypothetical protein EA393_15720 [Bacteroidetes bacterium]|nr:MAG: hypothetical protein EA393_15720 [Bacteroidota bacterium]